MQRPPLFAELSWAGLHFAHNRCLGRISYGITASQLEHPTAPSPMPPTLRARPERAALLCTVLDMAAARGAQLAVRFGCLVWAAANGHPQPEALAERMAQRWKVPSDCREFALLFVRQAQRVDNALHASAAEVMALFQACDALRRPGRMVLLLQACELNANARGVERYLPKQTLQRCLEAALSVPAAAVAAGAVSTGRRGIDIGLAVRDAQRRAIEAALSQSDAV